LQGFTFYVGPELEYFYFKNAEGTEFLDYGGYFDMTTLDLAVDLRRHTVLQLEEMGIAVEYSHHEVAGSQHEIDMKYTDALSMADNVMTYKAVVKQVAFSRGNRMPSLIRTIRITFPRPAVTISPDSSNTVRR
jgi:glutamine synthetase